MPFIDFSNISTIQVKYEDSYSRDYGAERPTNKVILLKKGSKDGFMNIIKVANKDLHSMFKNTLTTRLERVQWRIMFEKDLVVFKDFYIGILTNFLKSNIINYDDYKNSNLRIDIHICDDFYFKSQKNRRCILFRIYNNYFNKIKFCEVNDE